MPATRLRYSVVWLGLGLGSGLGLGLGRIPRPNQITHHSFTVHSSTIHIHLFLETPCVAYRTTPILFKTSTPFRQRVGCRQRVVWGLRWGNQQANQFMLRLHRNLFLLKTLHPCEMPSCRWSSANVVVFVEKVVPETVKSAWSSTSRAIKMKEREKPSSLCCQLFPPDQEQNPAGQALQSLPIVSHHAHQH